MQSATPTRLPRTTSAGLFAVLASNFERVYDRATYALSEALIQRNLYNRTDVAVSGPHGWLLRETGEFVAGTHDWEVLEIGYDAGRGTVMLYGFNRCTGEVFNWGLFRIKNTADERYGFEHARVVDERGVSALQYMGFAVA
ncbi:MAG: hypothetical protein E6Q97_07810 [Desulfurellales bacterium]|nr:MAG: hypothetical protein E6Q97_07810 [Desulfurellales bacterium]